MLPAFNTIYQHYADEVARLATITIETGAVSPDDPAYGPTVLVDDNPAKVAKIDATSGSWLFAYDTPQRIDLAALIHHSFDATVDAEAASPAGSVRIEGNATDDWTSPSFSAAFTIPPWFAVGTRRWPVNPWLDLTQQSGYNSAGFLFWRLVIENNSQDIQLGQVWFGSQIRRFDPDLQWGLQVGGDKPQIENTTNFQVQTIYPRGTTIWKQDADLLADDVMAAAFEQHWYDVEGRGRPWLLIPSGPVANDRAYLVRYATTDRQMTWNWENYHNIHLSFQEVGRGLRPGL
jgi:hypothetical protein